MYAGKQRSSNTPCAFKLPVPDMTSSKEFPVNNYSSI